MTGLSAAKRKCLDRLAVSELIVVGKKRLGDVVEKFWYVGIVVDVAIVEMQLKVEFPGEDDSEDEIAPVDNDMACSLAYERGFGTQSFLDQWRDSYGNGDYDDDPYDDNMYEEIIAMNLDTSSDNNSSKSNNNSSDSASTSQIYTSKEIDYDSPDYKGPPKSLLKWYNYLSNEYKDNGRLKYKHVGQRLRLANAKTWDAILSKTFGVKITPTMACVEEKKGRGRLVGEADFTFLWPSVQGLLDWYRYNTIEKYLSWNYFPSTNKDITDKDITDEDYIHESTMQCLKRRKRGKERFHMEADHVLVKDQRIKPYGDYLPIAACICSMHLQLAFVNKHLQVAFAACICKQAFASKHLQASICRLHLQLAFASKHLQLTFTACICILHLHLAFASCICRLLTL
ncbi:hypothetical protein Tco_0965224 [Tanacetum coccineum]